MSPAAKLKRLVTQCESREDLKEVIRAAQDRANQLRKQDIDRARDHAWSAICKAETGQVAIVLQGADVQLLVGKPGGRTLNWRTTNIPTGEVFRVWAVHPRAKRLWLKNDVGDKLYCLTPDLLTKIALGLYRDEMTAHIGLNQHLKQAAA